jgi:fructose-1,6-bisphosphatase/inositol monophosphatase family enzyme
MTVTSAIIFLNGTEQSQIRDLLRRTAKTEIMPRFQNLSAQDVSTKSRDDDLVTKADLASEAMITAELQNLFPHAVVVGEEVISKHPSLRTQMADHEICFVIDPIDGTWNFANGIPLFGIILSVLHFGRPIYGLLYDPVMDDFIEADLGQSTCDFSDAQDRRRSLRTAQPRAAEDLTGYIHFGLLPKETQFTLAPHLPKFRRTSVLRCSCHEYRILAQGHVDFCLSSILNPWDHAAGVLTTQLAGGVSKMFDDQEYNARLTEGYLLSASSEETWNTVADILRPVLWKG